MKEVNTAAGFSLLSKQNLSAFTPENVPVLALVQRHVGF